MDKCSEKDCDNCEGCTKQSFDYGNIVLFTNGRFAGYEGYYSVMSHYETQRNA